MQEPTGRKEGRRIKEWERTFFHLKKDCVAILRFLSRSRFIKQWESIYL